MLAPYACDPANTKGRVYPEELTPYRNEYERDKDRIIRSNAFKRLQYKTQIFAGFEGDHYRNRLTHSIEVSMVARSIAKNLNLSPDLAESVSLAHDLGHTPFAHAGEKALNDCMKDYGGFSHNAHSLKILTQLERKYAEYQGLNLTWEVIEGIIKHNGPLTENVPDIVLEYAKQNNIELHNIPSLEAQLASLADDIAYVCHDLEDIIKSEIIGFPDIAELQFIGSYIHEVESKFSTNIEPSRLIYEVTRRFINYLITSLLKETKYNLLQHELRSVDDIRRLNYYLVAFPKDVLQQINDLKSFLSERVYNHPKVLLNASNGQKVITDLFNFYMNEISFLPTRWQNLIINDNEVFKANIISDYIAGMTDRYANKLHKTLRNSNFINN